MISDVLISKDFRDSPESYFPFPFFICLWAWNLVLNLGLSIVRIRLSFKLFDEIGAKEEHLQGDP